MAKNPFAPIDGKKTASVKAPKADWEIVSPVPADAPPPPEKHYKLGAPTGRWAYRDAENRLLGFIDRYDPASGKEFRPLAYWRPLGGDAPCWRHEAWPAPRPLYGLDRLASAPDACVVICEGEKSADAAARLLPAYVSVTSPNGSKSAAKADWRALAGRHVILWPDADEAGDKYAKDVFRLCTAAGAASVAVVPLPSGVAAGWDAADAEEEGWTGDQVAALLAGAKPFAKAKANGTATPDDVDDGKGSRRRRPPARDSLVALTEFCDFWHGPDGTAFVTFPVNGHRENWKIRSERFRNWLTGRAYEENGGVPGGQAIEDALRLLVARATNDGPERNPGLRVMARDGLWYIDLCDAAWRVIEIRPNGWRILEKHDLPFVRTGAMQPLPMPQSGSLIEEARPFVNVATDDDFMTVVAWLVAALHSEGEYPILIIQGEQGSGKSTFSRILRSIVDPNMAPIRAAPKDEEDLLVAAKNGHVIALDNLSKVDPILADALCRVSTGGGFSTRVKYTNDEEHVVWARNPILINGIPSLANRPDLARRALIIHLRSIPDEDRRPDDVFWQEWREAAPGVLGALCDALSAALRRISTVSLARSSSMAYFEKLIEAASPGLGWESGTFSAAYAANRSDLDGAAFEADPVAMAIADMIRDDYPRGWNGTATRLLEVLAPHVPEGLKRSRSWPDSAQGLGNRIERVKPLLRQRGIIIERKHSGDRTISIVPKEAGSNP